MIEIMNAIKEQVPAKAWRLQKAKEFQSYAWDLAVEAEAGVILMSVGSDDMNGQRNSPARSYIHHQFGI